MPDGAGVAATRCKFVCVSKREYREYGGRVLYEYEFSAVMDGSPENKRFWAYTPAGTLKVSTVQTDQFRVGLEYYLDLTPAVVVDEPAAVR